MKNHRTAAVVSKKQKEKRGCTPRAYECKDIKTSQCFTSEWVKISFLHATSEKNIGKAKVLSRKHYLSF